MKDEHKFSLTEAIQRRDGARLLIVAIGGVAVMLFAFTMLVTR